MLDHSGDSRYSPLFIRFLYHFNVDRDYFECHEVLEALWMEEGRDPLYQGLLQAAVGLYHHRNGNVNGARKLFRAALEKLTNEPGDSLGIDLAGFRQQAEHYLNRLERAEAEPVSFHDLNIRILDPELERRLKEMRRGKNHTEES
ncbi:hypothetical protein C8P63_10925 [Melghirimyces profundicolus]|uniref:DUF309 domain-containing protein n=1 Tax=Melghirimyces profundicolus TaxID=1242148 RepID=A0A2T6BW18_9BACL|nr:DUF309 domain-containing protein [Melghirimyces profundicolus]PTX60261.1 hypothetical protein C8P63_10925 [Melghirimyces profundicolus]